MAWSYTLFKAIKSAVKNDDFNESLITVQNALGQDDGGVASVHFSGEEWKDIEDKWKDIGKKDRENIIHDYIKTELSYLGLAD